MQTPTHLRPASAPKVSVIIPSFNCAPYLSTALDSVLAQTMQELEVLVVDDGSTDGTAAVVAPYLSDPRVTYHRRPNGGVSAARNTGLKAAAAPYVMFVDADDALPAHTLHTLTSSLEQSGASWCITDVLKVNPDQRVFQSSDVPAEAPFYKLLEEDFVRRGVFFRREDLIAVGGYDESLKTREDWDINIRMLEHGMPFRYIAEPLYLYTLRGGSLTKSGVTRILVDTERVLRKHHKRLADSGDSRAATLYARNMWGLTRQHVYITRDPRAALRCGWESTRYDLSLSRLLHPLLHRLRVLITRRRMNSC